MCRLYHTHANEIVKMTVGGKSVALDKRIDEILVGAEDVYEGWKLIVCYEDGCLDSFDISETKAHTLIQRGLTLQST